MNVRVAFKMLSGKAPPPELDWWLIGEWRPSSDYRNTARDIYENLKNEYGLKSVEILRENEEIAHWSHLDEANARREVA